MTQLVNGRKRPTFPRAQLQIVVDLVAGYSGVPRPSWRSVDPYLNGIEARCRYLRQGKAFGSSTLDAFAI